MDWVGKIVARAWDMALCEADHRGDRLQVALS